MWWSSDASDIWPLVNILSYFWSLRQTENTLKTVTERNTIFFLQDLHHTSVHKGTENVSLCYFSSSVTEIKNVGFVKRELCKNPHLQMHLSFFKVWRIGQKFEKKPFLNCSSSLESSRKFLSTLALSYDLLTLQKLSFAGSSYMDMWNPSLSTEVKCCVGLSWYIAATKQLWRALEKKLPEQHH